VAKAKGGAAIYLLASNMSVVLELDKSTPKDNMKPQILAAIDSISKAEAQKKDKANADKANADKANADKANANKANADKANADQANANKTNTNQAE
jgi:hypothetical protein